MTTTTLLDEPAALRARADLQRDAALRLLANRAPQAVPLADLLSATAADSGIAIDAQDLGELAAAFAGLSSNRRDCFVAEMKFLGVPMTPAVEILFLVPRMSMLFGNNRFIGRRAGIREFAQLRQQLLDLLEADPWLAGPEVLHVTWRGGLTDWHAAPLLDCLGVLAPGDAFFTDMAELAQSGGEACAAVRDLACELLAQPVLPMTLLRHAPVLRALASLVISGGWRHSAITGTGPLSAKGMRFVAANIDASMLRGVPLSQDDDIHALLDLYWLTSIEPTDMGRVCSLLMAGVDTMESQADRDHRPSPALLDAGMIPHLMRSFLASRSLSPRRLQLLHEAINRVQQACHASTTEAGAVAGMSAAAYWGLLAQAASVLNPGREFLSFDACAFWTGCMERAVEGGITVQTLVHVRQADGRSTLMPFGQAVEDYAGEHALRLLNQLAHECPWHSCSERSACNTRAALGMRQ